MWSQEHRQWIISIDSLFSQLFGPDFLSYKYDKETGTSVDENLLSVLTIYNHDQWESKFANSQISQKDTCHATFQQRGKGSKNLKFSKITPTFGKKAHKSEKCKVNPISIRDENSSTSEQKKKGRPDPSRVLQYCIHQS